MPFGKLHPAEYRIETYLSQSLQYGTTFTILIDRNLFSSAVALGRGVEVKARHRTAAALLAFARYADLQFEPSMALYELAQSHERLTVDDELCMFRKLDSSDLCALMDVASMRVTRMAPDKIPELEVHQPSVDLSQPPPCWDANYLVVLKLASLVLGCSQPEQVVSRLLAWMRDEFLITAPGFCLASYYVAPNAQKRGLLKALRSPAREKAMAGLRNAAWDMAVISEWARRVLRQSAANDVALLASTDRALHRLARVIVAPIGTDDEARECVLRWTLELWGESRGRRVMEAYDALQKEIDDPQRTANRGLDEDAIRAMVGELEGAVRRWTP